jgi:hypothetical protein
MDGFQYIITGVLLGGPSLVRSHECRVPESLGMLGEAGF